MCLLFLVVAVVSGDVVWAGRRKECFCAEKSRLSGNELGAAGWWLCVLLKVPIEISLLAEATIA